MMNRQRMQALFDLVVKAGDVVMLTAVNGTLRQIPKDSVWQAFAAVCHGKIKDPIVTVLMQATGSNSRTVNMVRMLVKSIQQAQAEGLSLDNPTKTIDSGSV